MNLFVNFVFRHEGLLFVMQTILYIEQFPDLIIKLLPESINLEKYLDCKFHFIIYLHGWIILQTAYWTVSAQHAMLPAPKDILTQYKAILN